MAISRSISIFMDHGQPVPNSGPKPARYFVSADDVAMHRSSATGVSKLDLCPPIGTSTHRVRYGYGGVDRCLVHRFRFEVTDK